MKLKSFSITSLIVGICVLMMSVCLCSCVVPGIEGLYSAEKMADLSFEELIDVINSKDRDALRSMFSEESIRQLNDFEGMMGDLLDYVNGDLVSYDDWGGPVEEKTREDDEVVALSEWSCDVETTENRYRFAVKIITEDSANNKNEGIHSLYVIRYEDDRFPQCAYWGDNTFAPGIHVGVPSVE